MQLYKIYYDLYYSNNQRSLWGSYEMYITNIRDLFDKAYDMIRENETGYEDRPFDEEHLTGFELHFELITKKP